MRTITIAAYRRPDYLKEVLDSLAVAMKECPEYINFSNHVIIGIDPPPKKTDDDFSHYITAQNVRAVAAGYSYEVIRWPKHLGVDEHPRRLIQYAFSEADSRYNLHLEDDTVLSPDALRLALWFQYHRPAIEILSLYHPSQTHDRPDVIERIPGFSCWGWACTRPVWSDYLALNWNCKRDEPMGWDWSVTEIMKRHNLRAVAPVLSRVKNIGRERGEYQTPAGHDRDFAGVVQARAEDMQRVDQFRLEVK